MQMGSLCLICGFALFITGLATFVMGQAILLSLPRSHRLPLARQLRYLGAFALVQSLATWVSVALLWGLVSGAAVCYIQIGLSAIAATLLARFGCEILSRRTRRYTLCVRSIPFALGVICLVIVLAEALVWTRDGIAQLLTMGGLYLPGVALAALAFSTLRAELRAMGLDSSDRDARFVSASFVLHAVVVGSMVLPADSLVAWRGFSSHHYMATLANVMLPLTVLLLSVGVLRFLRFFDLETQRYIESLEQERLDALRRAEETQARLMQEIAYLGTQLESVARRRARRALSDDQDLARWREGLQAVAIAQERERISQELHDGIAQLVGYIDLRIQLARRSLLAGRMSEVAVALQEVEIMTQRMQGEIREAILGLRCGGASSDMVVCLSEYLKDFQERWGIVVELSIEDADALVLSSLAELQLLRVIQEALRNVRQHAAARHVWITFRVDGGMVVVAIEDDGKGFRPDEVQSGHFGLRLMQERCESVGGTLRVESVLGRGTRVEARLPLHTCGEEEGLHETDLCPDRGRSRPLSSGIDQPAGWIR